MNHLFRPLILIAAFALSVMKANAAVYTAVTSGSYSDSNVWAGKIPPPYYLPKDTVNIPSTFTVSLDTTLTVAGSAHFIVNGSVTGLSESLIRSSAGSRVAGDGLIDVDSIAGVRLSTSHFTGVIYTNTIDGSGQEINLYTGGSLNIRKRLHLEDDMRLSRGTMNILYSCTIILKGEAFPNGKTGGITTTYGRLSLPTSYDVVYTGGNITTTAELGGPGLNLVVVQLDSNCSVKLASPLFAFKKLKLSSGVLDLNQRMLMFTSTGDLEPGGNGKIRCNDGQIEVHSKKGLSGTLTFTDEQNFLGTFTINITDTNNNIIDFTSDVLVGNVNLIRGRVNAHSNNVRLPVNSILTGGSPDSYFILGDSGKLTWTIKDTSVNYFYPIGTYHHYAPCAIKNQGSNLVFDKEEVSVGLREGVKYHGTTGYELGAKQPLVNITWFIHDDYPSARRVTLIWHWQCEVNNFNRSTAGIYNYDAGWNKKNTSAIAAEGLGMYSVTTDKMNNYQVLSILDSNTSLAVKKEANTTQLSVYPNPAHNLVYLKGMEGNAHVEILNSTGLLVFSNKNNINTVDVSRLPPGVFFLRITNDQGVQTSKFIKQ